MNKRDRQEGQVGKRGRCVWDRQEDRLTRGTGQVDKLDRQEEQVSKKSRQEGQVGKGQAGQKCGREGLDRWTRGTSKWDR